MTSRLQAVAACAVLTVGVCGQSTWQLEGGRGRARAVGSTTVALEGAAARPLGPGTYRVHFPATDAGKPGSLQFDAPDDCSVVVGVAAGGAPRRERLRAGVVPAACGLGDGWWLEPRGERTAAARDCRLSVTVPRGQREQAFALVGREDGAGGCYAFVLDWGAAEARLVRALGGDRLVLRRAPLPVGEGEVTITLQVEGFRIEGLIDDAPLVRCFDGAISEGGAGVAWRGVRPEVDGPFVGEPVAPSASAAVVQRAGSASLYAWVPAPPGSLVVLELALDRPHPWVPRSRGGFEPWLRQPLAAPVVAWGDWRGSLGVRTVSPVAPDGAVDMQLRWPELVALRGRVALAVARVATADGGSLIGRTPAVRVVF
jgi:hypothetical protein